MMHLSTLVFALLGLTSLLGPVALARAPDRPGIPSLVVDDAQEGQRSLASSMPTGRWVMIVVDAHRVSGKVLMEALKTAGYDGRNAVVLVIGDTASASAARKRSSQLPTAQWLSARTAASLKALDLAGTPAVLGIDVGQRIVWQESGIPERTGSLAVRISDWIRP